MFFLNEAGIFFVFCFFVVFVFVCLFLAEGSEQRENQGEAKTRSIWGSTASALQGDRSATWQLLLHVCGDVYLGQPGEGPIAW